jgi:hypothetical protein
MLIDATVKASISFNRGPPGPLIQEHENEAPASIEACRHERSFLVSAGVRGRRFTTSNSQRLTTKLAAASVVL